jgi:claudin
VAHIWFRSSGSDKTIPEIVPRREFEEALFIGWIAGFSLVLDRCLLHCAACSAPDSYASGYCAVVEMQDCC